MMMTQRNVSGSHSDDGMALAYKDLPRIILAVINLTWTTAGLNRSSSIARWRPLTTSELVRHDKYNTMHNRFNVQFLFISNRRVKIVEQSLHDSRSHTEVNLCCFQRFTL